MHDVRIYKYAVKENDGFFSDLKQRENAFFCSENKSRHANGAMLFKMVVSLLSYVFFYLLIIFKVGYPYITWVWCVLMGIAGSWIFFNVVHDSSHNAMFRSKKLNRLFSYSFELIGCNSYIWNYLHNSLHHSFTSIENIEILTDVYPIIRMSENQPYRWIYRYQHRYSILVYSLFSLFWFVYVDFDLFAKNRFGNVRNIRHKRREWIVLWAGKLLYLFFCIVLPHIVSQYGWGEVVLNFLIMQIIMGLIVSVVSGINHFPENSKFIAADKEGNIEVVKRIYEFEATTDFSPHSKLASWLFGGFNTHAAHHLFPNICHIHYPKMNIFIRELAEKHSVAYKQRSLMGAIRSHFRYIKEMSVRK